jgi:hypothetical protein
VLKVAILAQGGHLGGEDYQAGDAGDHRRRRRCGRGTSGRCSWSSWLTGSGCPVCWTAGRAEASQPGLGTGRARCGPTGGDAGRWWGLPERPGRAPRPARVVRWTACQASPMRRFPTTVCGRDPSCFGRSCATGCTDLDRIVSLRWLTGCSWSCWVVATAGSSYDLANSSARLQPGNGRGDLGGGTGVSSCPAVASSRLWTALPPVPLRCRQHMA